MRRDDEEPRVGRRRHRRSSGRPRDQRDLAEEVATPERPHFAALALHLRLPVDEDEELPAERSFADELPPGAEVDLIGELRDLREFLLRAAREQWDALDRLNLRVTRERHDASHQSVGYSRRRSTIANDRQRLQRIRPDANPPGDLSISSPVDSQARAIAKHVLLGRRERSLTCSSLVAYAKRLAPHLAQLHVLPVSRRPSAFDWVSGRWLRPRRRCRIAGKQRIAESGTCIQDVASGARSCNQSA